MTRRFAICLALTSSVFMAPRPAAADTTMVFDTVDSVEFRVGTVPLYVTGILSGQSTPITQAFRFATTTLAEQCERSALMVISKPGKYRLRFILDISVTSCALIRTP